MNTCPQCHASLPADAPAGLCPQCLLKRALEPNTLATENPHPNHQKSEWTPPSVETLAPLFPELDLLELLGRGGMGAVYKARQKSLDRIVALKILPPQISHDPAFTQRFTHEAQALARLSHPYIVTIYDFGTRSSQLPMVSGQNESLASREKTSADSLTTDHWPLTTPLHFFLMEFVDGPTLRHILRTGEVTPKDALAIVPQICDALQYAHDRGIVHRDIKPDNILMTRQGQVKIADFGLAKLIASSNSEIPNFKSEIPDSFAAGTPAYMAPEQSATPSSVDHRADIYALGVVFYQLLTGELPPQDGTQLKAPSTKVQIDVRLDEIVLRALEKNPERRFTSATEFKTEIQTILATPNLPAPVPFRPEEQKLEPPNQSPAVALPPPEGWKRRWLGAALPLRRSILVLLLLFALAATLCFGWLDREVTHLGEITVERLNVGIGNQPWLSQAESYAPSGRQRWDELHRYPEIRFSDGSPARSNVGALPPLTMFAGPLALVFWILLLTLARAEHTLPPSDTAFPSLSATAPGRRRGLTTFLTILVFLGITVTLQFLIIFLMVAVFSAGPPVISTLLLTAPFVLLPIFLTLRRRSTVATGDTVANPPPPNSQIPYFSEKACRSLRIPAIGMAISAALLILVYSGFIYFILMDRPNVYALAIFAALVGILPNVFLIESAMDMLHLVRRRRAITVCCITIAAGISRFTLLPLVAGPFNLFCLIFSIWTLILLNRQDIRETFRQAQPLSVKPISPLRAAVSYILTVLLILIVSAILIGGTQHFGKFLKEANTPLPPITGMAVSLVEFFSSFPGIFALLFLSLLPPLPVLLIDLLRPAFHKHPLRMIYRIFVFLALFVLILFNSLAIALPFVKMSQSVSGEAVSAKPPIMTSAPTAAFGPVAPLRRTHFQSPAEMLAGLPTDARPGPQGWDEFSKPKADKWLEENITKPGATISVQAIVKNVSLKRVSPKGKLLETLHWVAEITLERTPFEALGTRIALKFDSQWAWDPNQNDVPLSLGQPRVYIAGDEAFARWARALKTGDIIHLRGLIDKTSVWEAQPPELWILVSEQSVIDPAITSLSAPTEATLSRLDGLRLSDGKVIAAPVNFANLTSGGREEWMKTHGVDLVADYQSGRWAFVPREVSFGAHAWVEFEDGSVTKVLSMLAIGDTFFEKITADGKPLLLFQRIVLVTPNIPFRTRDTVGILQIAQFNTERVQVRIRQFTPPALPAPER